MLKFLDVKKEKEDGSNDNGNKEEEEINEEEEEEVVITIKEFGTCVDKAKRKVYIYFALTIYFENDKTDFSPPLES